MNEDEFWPRLERRLTQEFSGLDSPRLRFLWCDGFVPEEYRLSGDSPVVQGKVWIGGQKSRRQESWEFVLRLPIDTSGREEVDWSSVLPVEGVTGWLSPDPDRKLLEMEPAAAYPD